MYIKYYWNTEHFADYTLNDEKKRGKENMYKVLSIYLEYSVNGNHYCLKTSDQESFRGFLFLHNFRVQNIIGSLRPACTLVRTHKSWRFSKRWKEIYFKYIKVWLLLEWCSSKKPKSYVRHSGSQAFCWHTWSAVKVHITLGCNTDGKEKVFQPIVINVLHQSLGDRDGNWINKHRP